MSQQHPANKERADRAKKALMAYHNDISLNPANEFDAESTLTDLLTDLHHFADSEKIAFENRLSRSIDCYKEEIAFPEL